jgi:hypothetical protein
MKKGPEGPRASVAFARLRRWFLGDAKELDVAIHDVSLGLGIQPIESAVRPRLIDGSL